MIEYSIQVNNNEDKVCIGGNGSYLIKGKDFTPEITELSPYSYLVKYENKVFEITCNKLTEAEYRLTLDGYSFHVTSRTLLNELAGKLMQSKENNSTVKSIKAPMPGLIVKYFVKEGDKVEKGTQLFILEAMKMENIIKSENEGVIEKIYFNSGASIDKDKIVISIK